MPKPDLKKHTLFLRDGDFDFLTVAFSARGLPASYVIRDVVARYVDALKAQVQEQTDE